MEKKVSAYLDGEIQCATTARSGTSLLESRRAARVRKVAEVQMDHSWNYGWNLWFEVDWSLALKPLFQMFVHVVER